jgi:hypothetical protein
MENEFTGQYGINATVNDINDSVELFALWDTGKLVDLIGKEINSHATQQPKKKILLKCHDFRNGRIHFPNIRISTVTILWYGVIWKLELQLKLLKETPVYDTWHP